MKFHLVMQDEVDLGILHETLLHLMTEHPPLVLRITVEFDSASFCDSGINETPTEWSPNAASPPDNSQDDAENTEETHTHEPPNYEEEVEVSNNV